MRTDLSAGFWNSAELRALGFKSVGENVSISRSCEIVGQDNIELGDHVRIDAFCSIIATGPVRMGRNVHIHTSVVVGGRGGVELADYVGISHGCHILSASDDFSGEWMTNSTVPARCTRPTIARIVIGRHVAVGTGVTFLPGVTVGDGAAIGAHSLVNRDIDEWTICAGTPATRKGARSRRLLLLEQGLDDPALVGGAVLNLHDHAVERHRPARRV